MKKCFKLANLLLILSMGLMFASCESDAYDAYHLTGEWQGDFGSYYNCRYRVNGQYVTRSFHTENSFIQFIPDRSGATTGTGYQVDFYGSDSPYEWISAKFSWTVENRNIHIIYDNLAPHSSKIIRDYHLNNDVFDGYFDNGIFFSMDKIDEYVDWGPYTRYTFNYYPYTGELTRGVGANISVSDSISDIEILSVGNRFAEGLK